MYRDSRIKEVSFEEAASFLESLKNQLIYVKLINETKDKDDNDQQIGMYNKLDVKTVYTKDGHIILHGTGEDRLFFDKDNIVSCKMTYGEGELLIIFENQEVSSTLKIKKC